MVVATLHLGRPGNGRWGGTGRLDGLVRRVSVGVTPRFAEHAVPPRHHGSQTMVDDRRIALAAAGIRPVMIVMRKSQIFGLQ